MANKHNHHHCECKHARLAFCAKCQVPHCLDCNKEWQDKQYGYWYYNTPWYGGVGTTTGYSEITGGSLTTTSINTGTLTTCQHDS